MKNEEFATAVLSNEEFATAVLSIIIVIHFIKLLFFFTVFIDETNKAINSLQSSAILSNSLSVKQSVSCSKLSQFIVSLASLRDIKSLEMKSELFILHSSFP
jgi:hypothetical protein